MQLLSNGTLYEADKQLRQGWGSTPSALMHRDNAVPRGLFSRGAMGTEILVGLGTIPGVLDPAVFAAVKPVEQLCKEKATR